MSAARPSLFVLAFVIGVVPAGAAEPREAGAAPTTPSEAERIEQLSAIGYVDAAPPARGAGGVIRYDPARAANGLNLLTSAHAPVAILMDMRGRVLHEWRAEFARLFPHHPGHEDGSPPRRNYWRDARLLPDGSIVAVWELFGIFELDRHSRVVWVAPVPAHHALQLTADGGIAHLQAERRGIPEIPDRAAIEDFIVLRDRDGKELRRLALSDALRNVRWPNLRRSFWTRARERGYGLNDKSVYDPFHTNALRLLSPAEAAALGAPFRAGDALVSMAMLDTIAIVDMDKGVARWSQQGPFGMQHDPKPTPDGRIVLFDNFLSPERSRVLALDPRTRRVTWEYGGPEEAPLHSRRSGRVEVLANGNFLVVETEGGRALEITRDREVVWELHSPFRVGAAADRVAEILSLERIDSGRVPWLEPPR